MNTVEVNGVRRSRNEEGMPIPFDSCYSRRITQCLWFFVLLLFTSACNEAESGSLRLKESLRDETELAEKKMATEGNSIKEQWTLIYKHDGYGKPLYRNAGTVWQAYRQKQPIGLSLQKHDSVSTPSSDSATIWQVQPVAGKDGELVVRIKIGERQQPYWNPHIHKMQMIKIAQWKEISTSGLKGISSFADCSTCLSGDIDSLESYTISWYAGAATANPNYGRP